MQGSQHDDPSWDARQLPSRVILSGTREPVFSSEPCNKAAPWEVAYSCLNAFIGSTRDARRAGR